MIIAKKVLLGGLAATLLFADARETELSTQQKAFAGTSFVAAGIFSGYLAYNYYQTHSSALPSTLFNLFFSAPCAAIGGIMITNAISEATDQKLINNAYEAHCLATRKYKTIIDRWNNGQAVFSELESLITLPIDSYLLSLRKMISILCEQEDALTIRLLHSFDNSRSEELIKQLRYDISNMSGALEQIHTILSENTIYFVENLGEDSMLEEVAYQADYVSAEQPACDVQMVNSEVISEENNAEESAVLANENSEQEAAQQENSAELPADIIVSETEFVQEVEQTAQIPTQEEAAESQEAISVEQEVAVIQ